MKIPLRIAIISIVSCVASIAYAATAVVSPACNSVTFLYPNAKGSNGLAGVAKDYSGMFIWKSGGSPVGSFVDYGYNNAYFANQLVPNNTYLYWVWSASPGDQVCAGSYCTSSGTKTETENFQVKTNCPPAVSVVSNTVATVPPVPVVDTSHDSNLVTIQSLKNTPTSITLGIDVSKLNLGHYQTYAALDEGTLIVTYKNTFNWLSGWSTNQSDSFLCALTQCDVGINQLLTLIPPDPKAGDGGNYVHEYAYDVYKLSLSGEAVVPTDAAYDLLRNGQEIATNASAAQTSFTDTGLASGESYAYTVRAPSIYARQGVTAVPMAISGSYQPGFYLSSTLTASQNLMAGYYKGSYYGAGGYTATFSGSPFSVAPVPLATSRVKSSILGTSGTYKPQSTIVLDIAIPYDAAGEYRTPGVISGPHFPGAACTAINNVPGNCLWNWTPESITRVAADKTYDVLRQTNGGTPVEVASRIAITQHSFVDTKLAPATSYTYTVRIPSVHSRDGIGSNAIGIPEAGAPQPLPTLASPTAASVTIVTPGVQSPPSTQSPSPAPGQPGAGSGGTSGGGSTSSQPGFTPGGLHEIIP